MVDTLKPSAETKGQRNGISIFDLKCKISEISEMMASSACGPVHYFGNLGK